MDKDKLAKFYPLIIGLGILVPIISIYLTFFAGGGSPRAATKGTKINGTDTPEPAATTGVNTSAAPRTLPAPRNENWAETKGPAALKEYYPIVDATVPVGEHQVSLPALRDELRNAQAGNDRKGVLDACSKLGDANDIHSVPTLIQMMKTSDDVYVRGRASAAITKIMGADYLYDPNGEPAKRAATVKRIEEEYARLRTAIGGN